MKEEPVYEYQWRIVYCTGVITGSQITEAYYRTKEELSDLIFADYEYLERIEDSKRLVEKEN